MAAGMGGKRHLASCILLAMAALICVFNSAAQAQKRHALVIGNDLYASMPAERQLQKAVNDARTMGEAFRSLGFDVSFGANLGRQGIIDKLAGFTARLAPGDTAAVFFAGHGVAIGGVNYLVPSDVPVITEGAEARLRGASIAEPDVIAEIQAKSVGVALLVIDACRDNPFPRAAGRSIGNIRGLADARPARGIFSIYSAGIGQSALDRLTDQDPEPNSVFTRIFAAQMVRPELHLGDLAVEVRERVAALALKATDRQGQPVPHEQTPAYYDQTLGGRIYLAAATSEVARPAPVTSAIPPPSPPFQPRVQHAVVETRQPDAMQARPRARNEICAQNGTETYCASSMLPPQNGNSYGPQNLFSGSLTEAWVEGRSGQGRGEFIAVDFAGPRLVRSMVVANGYQKNDDVFRNNSRVRRLELQFSSGHSVIVTLQDRVGEQILSLDPPMATQWIKFIIADVYPGARYADTALARLLVKSEPVP